MTSTEIADSIIDGFASLVNQGVYEDKTGKAEKNDYALENEQDEQGVNFLKASSGDILGFELNGETRLLSEDPKTRARATPQLPPHKTSEPPRRSPCGAARL